MLIKYTKLDAKNNIKKKEDKNIRELAEQADHTLFSSITNPTHCLHPLYSVHAAP